jgi:hypothetical protein
MEFIAILPAASGSASVSITRAALSGALRPWSSIGVPRSTKLESGQLQARPGRPLHTHITSESLLNLLAVGYKPGATLHTVPD